jgi:hypothetical protein
MYPFQRFALSTPTHQPGELQILMSFDSEQDPLDDSA